MNKQYLTIEYLSTEDLARIFSKINIDPAVQFNSSPCWTWTASQNHGYGMLRCRNQYLSSHRLMYAWLVSPLPYGKQWGELDHLCRNRACCNPTHLELVSSRINILRGASRAAHNIQKTHCPQGHPYEGRNILIYPGKPTHRYCRECIRIANQRRYLKNKDRIDAYNKAWRQSHKERSREHTRAYRLRKKQTT